MPHEVCITQESGEDVIMSNGSLLRRAFAFLTAAAIHCVCVLALTGTAAAEDQYAKLTPVSLRVDVFFYGAHAPLLMGIVDGIYKKYGLDVTAYTGRGSGTTIQTVANGSDQFGFADGSTLVKLVAQGLHAKQIVGMLETNPVAIIVFPDSGIKTPKDLEGKTGGFAPGSATDQLFPAFANTTGIDIKTIRQLAVDVSTRDSLFLLKTTDFDIANTAAQLPILQEKCACKLNTMRFADYGLTMMSNGIVASDKLIAENPDLVRRFTRATVEAIDLAVKNPQHAVDAFFQYAKDTTISRQAVADQWNQAIQLLHTKATAHKPTGYMDEGDWQKTIDLLVKFANVPQDTVMPNMVYTNAFLPQ
jgi:NitT/TauT family transport system substrate-binding protein